MGGGGLVRGAGEAQHRRPATGEQTVGLGLRL